ncbi:phosphotransferase [Sulfurimonas autotrophica]|uniref:Aminoglycoside phosphotransferase n=1 Tax=Sulfurimonas autotrophica (strain ATCC BAA-671 / DSM 16294 / JCM 11897 / OK10) TaxID=563040 RepID=E0USW1_SULAO|nr:phosphotransferase [Sulfurimonas autotrophica]ADN08138.1 aminoglycoside phosphotransferase [Sulfurimonas autotrophica DSM 16294]
MGVKTPITLQEANLLFPAYDFTQITPTKNGIIDTTYIINNATSAYILKKYERDISKKIQIDKTLLNLLSAHNLNVPKYLQENQEWYLYTKLSGEIPKNVQLYHIHALARFMAKFHNISKKITYTAPFLVSYEINKLLASVKKSHYAYYKKLSCLHNLDQKHDGFIHGDIFTDNTLFDKEKIAVFDFIDGGLGEFSFDTAIALLSFNPSNKRLHVNAFLRAYNQTSKKKISYDELQKQLKIAAKFYALLRISHDKKTKRAQELANFW